jgi:alpha-L-fucosidase
MSPIHSRRDFLKLGLAAAALPSTAAAWSFHDGRDWFRKRRFGMFIHWGIYALGGYHEQHMFRKRMNRADYARFVGQFNPVKFNPDAWLDLMAEAGMEYLTFTTKHVDGFCMWDSAHTDYKITRTPYGKDVLAMLAKACRRREVPLSLYYSCADMHHPNYPNAGRDYELPQPAPGDQPDLAKYLAYVKDQVRELCTKYGKIHGFWWDANVLKHRDPSFNTLIRQLQPDAVINNRGYDEGDFGTPERDWYDFVDTEVSFDKPIEACQSVGYQSWSWREDEDRYTDAHLIRSIQKVMAKGGNYLLNVGPKPDGTIDEECAGTLRRIGKWYSSVRESLVDVQQASRLTDNRDVALTRRGNTLYVHLLKEPETSSVFLPLITAEPRKATLLNTGEALSWDVPQLPRIHNHDPNRLLRIRRLPVKGKSTAGWVFKLEFDRLPETPAAATSKEEETK